MKQKLLGAIACVIWWNDGLSISPFSLSFRLRTRTGGKTKGQGKDKYLVEADESELLVVIHDETVESNGYL